MTKTTSTNQCGKCHSIKEVNMNNEELEQELGEFLDKRDLAFGEIHAQGRDITVKDLKRLNKQIAGEIKQFILQREIKLEKKIRDEY